MKVQNMIGHAGRGIENQFEIEDRGMLYFQSYQTIIVKIENGKTYLDEKSWDCSVTTGKYRNLFLGETKKETEKKIKAGEYILMNLN